jgi:hypothetical protein
MVGFHPSFVGSTRGSGQGRPSTSTPGRCTCSGCTRYPTQLPDALDELRLGVEVHHARASEVDVVALAHAKPPPQLAVPKPDLVHRQIIHVEQRRLEPRFLPRAPWAICRKQVIVDVDDQAGHTLLLYDSGFHLLRAAPWARYKEAPNRDRGRGLPKAQDGPVNEPREHLPADR